jgi:hypothetical protein
MAKETKAGATLEEEKKLIEKNCMAMAEITCSEPTERETFRQFMLALAGRDDSNYKTAPKIADDAAALTAEYFKRASKFAGV